MEKCLPSVPSRKRSRSVVQPMEQSDFLPRSGREVIGSGIGQMATQIHAISSSFELEGEKPEERTKIDRRTRISLKNSRRTGVRTNTPARSSECMGGDREELRLPINVAAQDEEQTLSIGLDGWEKSKMKKKQSRIKSDASPSMMTIKPTNRSRELKQDVQPRLPADVQLRLNGVRGFSLTMWWLCFIYHYLTTYRKKVRNDFSSASRISNTKMNSNDRAPETGSHVLHKLSQVLQQTTAINDWELSRCTLKLPAAIAANNRRQMPSLWSSSPPVGNWAQKISCTARRRNFVPVVSNDDNSPVFDAISDVAGKENGSGLQRRLSRNSLGRVYTKADQFPAAASSESEELEGAEVKYLGKDKKTDELEEMASHNMQKVSSMVLPLRKNKFLSGDELGGSVGWTGRATQGFASTRSLMPMVAEKLGNSGTATQLRSVGLGFYKIKRKVSRQLTHKLSECKAYTHQRATTNAATYFRDDEREELLVAAASVLNSAHNFSSPFWRQMEPYFSFISDVDIAYLKQQEYLVPTSQEPTSVPPVIDSSDSITNEFGLIEPERDFNNTKKVVPDRLAPGTMNKEIPLCQRLIAALILEEGIEEQPYSRNEDLEFDVHGTEHELDALAYCTLNLWVSGKCQRSRDADLSGCGLTVKGRSLNEFEHNMLDADIMATPEKRTRANLECLQTGVLSDQALSSNMACSEFQYGKLSINERAILEMQSVGLYPEPLPDLLRVEDEKISNNICKLKDKYHEQVTKKKAFVGKLLSSALGTRACQEKEFEHSALNKLLVFAYEKYKACWGPKASGAKGASSKMAKQAASAFVKRTLGRCQKFETTGKSCFSEPLYRDMFLSGLSHLHHGKSLDSTADDESSKQYGNTFGCSLEGLVSGSMVTQQSASLNNNHGYSSNDLISANHSSERTIAMDDTWSNEAKKRELLLNVVSGVGGSPSHTAKRKRGERDKEEKGKNNRELLSENGTTEIGQLVSGSIKGERKSKAKPKKLSASVSSLLDKQPEAIFRVPKSSETTTSGSVKERDGFGLDDAEAFDILGVQGQDIQSWLNIDDDDDGGLQDQENCTGLEIPMDDLADLNLVV
ncbi:uncharacterized protein LOC127794587 isoform X2 [Diospyros lotus]|uniref:uncharacterized protein LOC127794587 isoform X2 n=1 Tax=Diospyros lotus TaxID=55363 RepID=UPI00225571F5|nr:uncharacterized protein LOC127794587 isoform X2 [Diospyros lotus]